MTTIAAPIAKEFPRELTLDGKVYSVDTHPELKAFSDGVASVVSTTEKQKLYGKIEAVKAMADKLASVQVVNENDNSALVKEISDFKQVITDRLGDLQTRFESSLDPLVKDSKINQAAKVNNYRAELLAKNQGKCIPEYVVGNTIEELDAALAESVKIVEKYGFASTPAAPAPTVTAPVVNAPVSTAPVQAPAPIPVIAPPANVAPVSTAASNVAKMSPKEFAKNREALKAELESLVDSGSV